MQKHDWNDVITEIEKAQKILIFTHVNMDGDAAGSAAALCHVLRMLGKEAWIIVEDKFPEYVSFLDRSLFVSEAPYLQDLSIAVDLGDDSRLENRVELFYKAKSCIVIDHHIKGDASFKFNGVVDHSAAAAGLLVYELVNALELRFGKELLDKETATALYTAILTDTGGFKYDSTGAECFRIAADLVEKGADNAFIANHVFDNKPLAQIRIDALAVDRAVFSSGGKGVVSIITLEDMEKLGALPEYTENAVNVLRSLVGVEIVALIKERAPGFYKISFRAKEYADVRSIAQGFSGGGHMKAAGGQIEGDPRTASEAVRRAVDAFFEAYRENI